MNGSIFYRFFKKKLKDFKFYDFLGSGSHDSANELKTSENTLFPP